MLTPFPELLQFGLYSPIGFVPLLLRLTLVISFLYMASFLYRERSKLIGLSLPIVGHMRSYMVWFSTLVAVAVAFFLFIGLCTQWAVLVGLLMALKHLVFFRRYHAVLPFARSTYMLMLVMCLILLLTGAGSIFAFDLPL
jgi:hypothetical protein